MDENHRLQYHLFMDDDGLLKPDFIEQFGEGKTFEEAKANRGLAAAILGKALTTLMPYAITYDMNGQALEKVTPWMKDNVHDAWQLSMRDGQTVFIFARDVDAINFKMAWT